ncbi:MAG: radical SAM protein, partial [Candidatus Cloacimonetes bacterium]|nr:radical SAM protein [Candidatus Cloacimonadota bacterium]
FFMTTTTCNFSCNYCIEDNIKKNYFITMDVVNAFLVYIKNYIKDKGITSLYITLYGGEPTLSWDLVVYTLSKVKNICIKNNTVLTTGIITNGYFFRRQHVQDLMPFNFQSIQITLDGSKEFHDKRRFTKNKKPTFDVIVSNLKEIFESSSKVRISLRMNCDKENIASLKKFSSFIYSNFGNERLFIDFGYIVDNNWTCISNNTLTKKKKENVYSEIEFAEQLPTFYKTISESGYSAPDYYAIDGLCSAKTNNSFTLHPSGDVYKCVWEAGIEEYKECTIFDPDLSHTYFNKELYMDCINKKCCFLPLCQTGCPFKTKLRSKEFNGNNCLRKQYEDINKKFIIAKLGSDKDKDSYE